MLAILFMFISVAQADSNLDFRLDAEVGFDQIRPILESRCMNCHGQSSAGAVLIDWSDYNAAFERREELNLRVVELRNMPMYSKMPNEEREIIRLWIEQGAKK